MLGGWEVAQVALHTLTLCHIILYSQKIWRGIKFGGLAVLGETTKLKSAKIYTACMYVWRYCSRPPNLNPQIHSLGANLMTANISGYTVMKLLCISMQIN